VFFVQEEAKNGFIKSKSYLVTQVNPSPPSRVRIGRLSGVGALWDCVHRVCGGGGGCVGGGVTLGAVLALSWCGEVSLGGEHHHH